MDLLAPLKKHFGYDAFRPLQEEIVRDALAGRDVFALMPTGGGKSLCFQLPALLREGLTIVVSPLIALMKDQVDALQASGVAATFLNSSLDGTEARARLRGLYNGEFRLLYVAPERLMLEGFLEKAQNWNIAQIAIDEAHCISEWGHDFRPEYRELKKLRTLLPDVPTMALTATATTRVREDILKQLKLRDPQMLRRQFRPAESDLSRRSEIDALRSTADLSPSAAAGKRHRLLREPQIRRLARAQVERGRHPGEAVSRRARRRRARAESGNVSARRRARDHGHDRLRDGDQ